MKLFECGVCGHIEFDEAPAKCLVCRADGSAFKENPGAVNQPADPAALTEGEQKHIPKIVVVKECGLIPESCCTDVHARVGEVLHVMKPEHYIRYLDYYLDRRFISRVWLSPEKCRAAAGLHLAADAGAVTVIENCNVHGNWMAEASL